MPPKLPGHPDVIGWMSIIAGISGYMGSLELERAIQEQLQIDMIGPANPLRKCWRELFLDFRTTLADSLPLSMLAAPAPPVRARAGSCCLGLF